MRALPSERLPLLFFKGEIGISRGTVRSKILERERRRDSEEERGSLRGGRSGALHHLIYRKESPSLVSFVELTDSTKSQANALVSWTTPDLPNTNFDEPEK